MNLTPDWSGLGTGQIGDCMGRFGAMNADIRCLVGGKLSGPALTVEVAAGENGTIHRAIAEARPGSVLVISAGADMSRAVWGEILCRAATKRGIRGVVIDGAVRDLDDLRDLRMPTFARGSTPAGPHKGWPGRINAPISCGGTVVNPADTVVADGDGVVVIPAADVPRIYQDSLERSELEDEWIRRIDAGELSTNVLGIPR